MSDVGFVACVALSDEPSHPGMVWIPGGTFRMGSDKHYPEEAPSHRVTVSGFWMDRTPVTNRDFRKFVNATGYVTFAETRPDARDCPGALPHMLKAGSLVFTHAAEVSKTATTPVRRKSQFPARSSKRTRISARGTTAAAPAWLPATRKRWIRPRATLAFDASQGGNHE
jgi:formylglycine-generating enzyme required for sulfatase activity